MNILSIACRSINNCDSKFLYILLTGGALKEKWRAQWLSKLHKKKKLNNIYFKKLYERYKNFADVAMPSTKMKINVKSENKED
jgi:hypothetical protein